MAYDFVVNTIGCSTHTLDSFVNILKIHQITAVVDVRSTPYSRHTPHFNRETLKIDLAKSDIRYIYMGNEFGARRKEPETYSNGRVNFEKVFKQTSFRKGVRRLLEGLKKGFKIALMCTEKDPTDCHRSIMVTRYLTNILNIGVKHILFDGNIEDNHTFENRLKKIASVKPDLFTIDESALVIDAYRRIEQRIAYKREEA